MSSITLLFCCCCVIASVFGEIVREEVIAQNEIKCGEEEICSRVTALTTNIAKQANELKELKGTVINVILPKLGMHSAVLINILAELKSISSKIDKSEVERRMQAEDLKVIAMRLDEQTEAEKLRKETINNLTVSINDQSKVLEKLTILTSTVSSKLQKHSEDLLDHEKNLKTHDERQRTQHEEFKGICGAKPIDCQDIFDRGHTASGVYQVYPGGLYPASVYCDMTTPGGPWMVFQRRRDGSVNFERTWKEYTEGFGALTGEFWLGNEKLHLLTNQRKYKLRIELEDFDKQKRQAEYNSFGIGSRTTNFRLSASDYSGNAGDCLQGRLQKGMQFSTKDADHDTFGGSCAQTFRGAWWYGACHACNLNGLYHKNPTAPYAIGVTWSSFRDQYYSLKAVEMKIARVK